MRIWCFAPSSFVFMPRPTPKPVCSHSVPSGTNQLYGTADLLLLVLIGFTFCSKCQSNTQKTPPLKVPSSELYSLYIVCTINPLQSSFCPWKTAPKSFDTQYDNFAYIS